MNYPKKKLKLPVSQEPFPESRELSMDDYYKAVVMVRQAMPCWPDAGNGGNERFVIRDEGEECPPQKP